MDKVIGKKIGEGNHRIVYEYLLNDNYVVKVNKVDIDEDANSAEYFYYELLKKHGYEKYLFPCKYDKFGNFIMVKAKEFLKPGKYEIPIFFVDNISDNWAIYEGRPACLDYACLLNAKNKKARKLIDGIFYFKKDKSVARNKGTKILIIE